MGRAALDKNWSKFTPAQQKEFLSLFRELFQRTYVQKLLLFERPDFAYVGEQVERRHARVDTKIITPRDEFAVTYQMRADGDHWLATDIKIEDLSLTANFRRQLDRLLAKSSPEEVLDRMRTKYGPGGKGGEDDAVKLLRVMLKDLRLIARDRSALVLLLLVPMVVIVVVAETTGGKGTQSILFPVVNEDQGPVANALHQDVSRAPRRAGGRSRHGRAAGRGREQGAGDAGAARRHEQALSHREAVDHRAADRSGAVDGAAGDQGHHAAGGSRGRVARRPVLARSCSTCSERSLTGSRMKLTHIEQNVPGFSVMFVLLSLIFSVSFGLRDEETWGTSGRLSIAPVSQATILGGKLLARFVVGTAQLLILLLFGHFVYGLSLGHSPLTLFLVASTIVFSMACFSVIVAALARTREQIIPVGMSAVFVLAALGGCWWPFYEQPKWMQTMGKGVMTTWSMFAIHDVMLRDKSLLEIAPKVLLLLAYGVVSFSSACGCSATRRTEITRLIRPP